MYISEKSRPTFGSSPCPQVLRKDVGRYISTWGAVGIIIGYTHGKNFHEWGYTLW